MPPAEAGNLVRIVTERSGRVVFRTELVVRFKPWINRLDDGALNAVAGPERLVLRTPTTLCPEALDRDARHAHGACRRRGLTH